MRKTELRRPEISATCAACAAGEPRCSVSAPPGARIARHCWKNSAVMRCSVKSVKSPSLSSLLRAALSVSAMRYSTKLWRPLNPYVNARDGSASKTTATEGLLVSPRLTS